MKIVVSVLLIIHGLITASQASGSFNPTGGVPNPKWLSWWPIPLGQSWLLARFGLEGSFLGYLAGVLWLIAGVSLIAAGLGLLGLIVPRLGGAHLREPEQSYLSFYSSSTCIHSTPLA